MIFGEFPIDQSEGLLLAHTVRIGSSVVKKGCRMTRADVDVLRSAGATSVIGALLEADELDENDAAATLGAALAGSHLEARSPSTGRCNLHAIRDGLLVIAPEVIDAINLTGGELTVGTLKPWTVVRAGEVVATIKTIPFAVRRELVEQCCLIAAQQQLALAVLQPHRAALILSESGATRSKVLDATVGVTRERLEALGSRLALTLRCEHDSEAVRLALLEARAAGCDLVLVSGASVTKDCDDIVPTAIRAAGGLIEHFGMPVEPGNMLLLARIDEVPVINLPGCARGRHENGLDWVLHRLLAKLPLTARDVMRMGVGGLIRNSAERDEMPLAAKRSNGQTLVSAPRIAAMVLAAGRSTRMGGRNKLLADVGGVPMVRRVVSAAEASRAETVVVVTGFEAERIEALLNGRDVTTVHNADFEKGMATSIAAGIRALSSGVDGVVILLADMPYVKASHIDKLIDMHRTYPDSICAVHRLGRRGNPMLWPRREFDALAKLSGDEGGRALLDEREERLRSIEIDSQAIFRDIDTIAALAQVEID